MNKLLVQNCDVNKKGSSIVVLYNTTDLAMLVSLLSRQILCSFFFNLKTPVLSLQLKHLQRTRTHFLLGLITSE